MPKLLISIIALLFFQSTFSQTILYQDNCQCGVVSAGDGNANYYSPDLKIFNLLGLPEIPQGATIKYAFLTFSLLKIENTIKDSDWENIDIQFNQKSIELNLYQAFAEDLVIFSYDIGNPEETSKGSYYLIDVTDVLDINLTQQKLFPYQMVVNPPKEFPATEYFYLTVVFEHPSLSYSNIVIASKNQSVAPIDKFNFNGLINPIKTSDIVALSINASEICNEGVPDSSNVYINNLYMGSLSLDEGHYCGGVYGNMYFNADTLIAYENDIANNSFSGADGVANIQPYLTNSTDLDIQFKYFSVGLNQGTVHWYTNPIHQLVLAYTTTCEEFTVSTPEPQAVCKNEPLQLSVSGGSKYEWLPQRGLSCYDCPNPLVSTDSSRFYTVRVWNNDSCSVVRPVHVMVNELPRFNTADIIPTQCAVSTGKIAISKHASVGGSVTWSLNGGAFETGGATVKNYENLPEGSYTITLKDDNGCTRDTTVELGYTVNTTANFALNPEKGVAPLTVNVTDQSTNYTNSAWYLQNNFTDSSLTQFTLDQSGTYTLQLITWYKDPKCADTAERKILVYDTLVVAVPNVFSPNSDGVNDFFGIQSNQPAEVSYQLLNRWGNVVHEGKTNTPGEVFLPLWDGNGFEEGVYFYLISIEAKDLPKQEVKGFFHLER